MKKIGFVDYYISEWHANNYPEWIKRANEKLGTDYLVSYAWAEENLSPVYCETTDEWCGRMGVTRCDTIAELCEKSDVIIVLAPSNPEKHLQYAKEVLPFGKRTYIDKTFAPNLKTAEEIFKIAEQCGTPFFSTSAMRFADELNKLKGANNLIITAGGGNFPEYMIHPVEMTVKLLEDSVKKVKVEKLGEQRICHAETENGKRASIVYSPLEVTSINCETKEGDYTHIDISSEFFIKLIEEIIKFFDTGLLPFDIKQTLEVMRFRDALLNAENADENWLLVNGDGCE